jgi:hypothetical protein
VAEQGGDGTVAQWRVQVLGLGFQGRGKPFCRAAGQPRHEGPGRGLAGDLGGRCASGRREEEGRRGS